MRVALEAASIVRNGRRHYLSCSVELKAPGKGANPTRFKDPHGVIEAQQLG
jgi:hypothetical protein